MENRNNSTKFSLHGLWIALILHCASAMADPVLLSSLLPTSRSAQVNMPVTVFATVLNAGDLSAVNCGVSLQTSILATLSYQTTDPATNLPTGTPDTPVNISLNQGQSFILTITPTAPLDPTEIAFNFECANADPAPVFTSINTLLLSASATPTPDLVALAATSDGDGIVRIPAETNASAFAVASVNVGAMGTITATPDTGAASLPLSLSICATDPVTAACTTPASPAASATIDVPANATPTFSIFLSATGDVPANAASNRVFVRFTEANGTVRGATSVAVQTEPPVDNCIVRSAISADRPGEFRIVHDLTIAEGLGFGFTSGPLNGFGGPVFPGECHSYGVPAGTTTYQISLCTVDGQSCSGAGFERLFREFTVAAGETVEIRGSELF